MRKIGNVLNILPADGILISSSAQPGHNMACKKEHVPFSGTPQQEAALKKVIAELKDTKGALMPIMQQAQEIYGYLPIEVQTMISDETGIPLEKIYGVSTFYSQFDILLTKLKLKFR